jgi:leader peptidase (prepilin peptidase)/N-methyltransferase
MPLADALAGQPALLITAVALLGAAVGSFLNVVALRLPRMLEWEWKHDAREILELPPQPADTEPHWSLHHPPSRCPHCGTPIKPWHNIPILGWLWLRGRAACCGQAISIQYPLVEGLSLVASALCAWRFGYSPTLVAALVLSWTLLALSVIDFNTHLLPDALTQPLLWLGLLLSLAHVFTSPVDSIIGAAAGYLVLWSLYHGYRLLTGKEGMGYGDFKLLAALGAWFGWRALPEIILLSSLVGAIIGITLILSRRLQRDEPIGFGPYLAGAGFIALLWGDALKSAYFQAMGLH